MKPIYAVIYQELYELHLVGAYEDYQDAYNAMVKDLRTELIYGLPGDGNEEKEADKIMSEVLASDDMLDDFKDYPGLAIELNKDAGKAYLNVRRIETTWEIVRIEEVIKHQNIKEDKNNGQA